MTRQIYILFFAFFTITCLSLAGPAQAEPKPWIWGWWPSHWDNLDFTPYPENGTDPHNSRWNGIDSDVSAWLRRHGNDLDLIRRFYSAGILKDQYRDDGVPVLEVGPNFYHLGGADKRRVTAAVDRVYGITSARPDGMFRLYDWHTGRPVGVYTKYGLSVQ